MSNRNTATAPTFALTSPNATYDFTCAGTTYRWVESPVESKRGTRSRSASVTGAIFTQTIVLEAEHRGARGMIYPAAPALGFAPSDVRWIAWRGPHDASSVWGLYLATDKIDSRHDNPANDSYVLIAWGDGATLSWVDSRTVARTTLSAALRVPPPWFTNGMRSRDESFPVRIEPVSPRKVRKTVLGPVAIAKPGRDESHGRAAPAAVLLEIVHAWKRAHAQNELTR